MAEPRFFSQIDEPLIADGVSPYGRNFWRRQGGVLGSVVKCFAAPEQAALYGQLHFEAHLWIHSDFVHDAWLILDVDEAIEIGRDFVMMPRHPGINLRAFYPKLTDDPVPRPEELPKLFATIDILMAEATTPADRFIAVLIHRRIHGVYNHIVYDRPARRFYIEDLEPTPDELAEWKLVAPAPESCNAPMTDERELYAAVLADPDNDDRRRALAAFYDRRQDRRGELIRIQLESAAKEAHGELDGALLRRQRMLINAHGREWAAPLANLVPEFKFHRGLIGQVTLPLDRFLDVAPALFALAPIQHVDLTAPRTRLAELLGSPHLDRLTSLGLEGQGLDDADAQTIAGAERLDKLRWLSLANNGIGRPGIEALAASPVLAHLDVLDLSNNPCDPVPRPAGWKLDGRVTAIERPALADELEARYGKRPWLANPANPDAWPLPRDSYRRRGNR